MRAPALFAALLALAVSVSLAGCASGSNSSSPPALSAAEWRREASAICREIGRKVRAVPRPRTDSETSPFIAAVLPLWKRQADRIGALVAPPEIAVPATGYLTGLQQLEEALVEIHISTQRDDEPRQFNAVGKTEYAVENMRLQAHALAVPACAPEDLL